MMTTDRATVLREALFYASLGWRVIPLYGIADDACHCRKGRDCPSPGKHPCLREWQRHASCDESVIRNWFESELKYPKFQANLGVGLGELSGIVDFEWDTEEGKEVLLDIFRGKLPQTCTFQSHRGFHHIYLWHSRLPAKANLNLGGLDLKLGYGQLGSQSVFPPSLHASGVHYKWLIHPSVVPPAAIPDEVVDRILEITGGNGRANGGEDGPSLAEIMQGVPKGLRNNSMAKAIGHLLWDADDLSPVTLHAVLDMCYKINEHNQPPMANEELMTIFWSIVGNERKKRGDSGRKTQGGVYVLEGLNDDELEKTELKVDYLIENVLVKDQPAVLGGAAKTMKTTTLCALALSLASGEPFLGKYEVLQTTNVMFLSGESGMAVLKETAAAIRKQMGISSQGERIFWSDRLPSLSLDHDLDVLRREMEQRGIGALFIDPAYMSLLTHNNNVRPGDVFAMGQVLDRVTQLGKDTGGLPLLAHHANKSAVGRRMTIFDLSQSGFAEWCRQWILISRMKTYEQAGDVHRLWFETGGSAGHKESHRFEITDQGFDEKGQRHRVWQPKLFLTDMDEIEPTMEEKIIEVLTEGPAKKAHLKSIGYNHRKETRSISEYFEDEIRPILIKMEIVDGLIKSEKGVRGGEIWRLLGQDPPPV